jgi:hypothetical protein
MRWLESLLRKCQHAFAVQFEGSLCCHIPASCRSLRDEDRASYNYADENEEGYPDLASKLVGLFLVFI